MLRSYPLAIFGYFLLLGSALQAQEVPEGRVRLVRETGGHVARPYECVFTPDGKRLISAGQDRTVQVWDVLTKERLHIFRSPAAFDNGGAGPTHLTVDPKGEQIAFWVEAKGDDGKKVRTTFVCSLANGEVKALKGGRFFVFAQDGKSIYRADAHDVHRIEIATGKIAQSGEVLSDKEEKKKLVRVALSLDGKTLAAVTQDERVFLLDAATLTLKRTLTVKGNGNELRTVDWADNDTLVCTNKLDELALVVLDASSGNLKHSYRFAALTEQLPKGGDSATLVGVQVIPGTQQALVRTRNRDPQEGFGHWTDASFLFHWKTGQQHTAYLKTSAFGSSATAISADRTLAVQGDGDLNDLILWDPQIGASFKEGKQERRLRGVIRGAAGTFNATRWHPNGKAIAWENLFDEKYRGCAQLDLTTLTMTTRNFDEIAHYDRGILTNWDGLTLAENKKTGKAEVGGGPNRVTLPPAGVVGWDLSFVAGGRVAVDTWNSPKLQIFDAATGMQLFQTRVVDSYIKAWAVSPKPNGRYLLIGSVDQTLTIYNTETGKILLTFFPAGRDWIAWTPEGYYAATIGGERLMGWEVDNGPRALASFYPAERFRKTFYRPDVLKLVLEKGSVLQALQTADAALKRETKQGTLEQHLPPRVTLEIVDATLPKIKVRASATARCKDQPILGLRLLLDGRSIQDQESSVEFPGGVPTASATWEITLPGEKAAGSYKLAALARSADAQGQSNIAEVSFVKKTKLPTLHILTIGINKYRGAVPQLNVAVKDAEDVDAAFLALKTSGLYGAVNERKPLLNAGATKTAVLAELAALRKQVKWNDQVVIFFAGHGVKDTNEVYLLTEDAIIEPSALLTSTALSGGELRRKLGEFPCQVLFMIDACHPGAFGAEGALTRAGYKPATEDLVRDLTNEDGVAILCAAMGTEKAQERKENGLFAQAILSALEGGPYVPRNRYDGLIYLHHFNSFIFDEVVKKSGDKQHPLLRFPWTMESFPIAKSK